MRLFLLVFLSVVMVLTARASETGSEFGFSPQDGRGGAPSSSSGSYSSGTSKVGFGWIVYWPKGSSPTDGRPSVSYSVGTSSGYSGSPTLTGDGLRYYQLHGVTTVSYSSGVTVTMSLDGTAVCTATCTGHGSTTSDWSLVGNYPAWSGGTAPTIDSATLATSATVGGAANYSVSVSGTPPLSYQWKVNGTAVTGATSSTWSINPVAKTDDGKVVTCVVTNAVGSATAGPSTLVVYWGPDITVQPQGGTVTEGQAKTLSVTASAKGGHTMTYQWKKNGVSISGATSSTYTIPTAGAADAATYTVVVTDAVDSVSTTSSGAAVEVTAWSGGVPGAQAGSFSTWTVKVIVHAAAFDDAGVSTVRFLASRVEGSGRTVLADFGDLPLATDGTYTRVIDDPQPERYFSLDTYAIQAAGSPSLSFQLGQGWDGAYPSVLVPIIGASDDPRYHVATGNDGAGNWFTTIELFPSSDPPPSTSTGSAVQVTNPQDFYAPFKSAMTDALNDTSKLPSGWESALTRPWESEDNAPAPEDFESVDTSGDGGLSQVQGGIEETVGAVGAMKGTASGLYGDYKTLVDGLYMPDSRVTSIPLGQIDYGGGNVADLTLDLSDSAPLKEPVNWIREALLYVMSVTWLCMTIVAIQEGVK